MPFSIGAPQSAQQTRVITTVERVCLIGMICVGCVNVIGFDSKNSEHVILSDFTATAALSQRVFVGRQRHKDKCGKNVSWRDYGDLALLTMIKGAWQLP